jgi:glycosyltransferase involved in cell wall biosynthesis
MKVFHLGLNLHASSGGTTRAVIDYSKSICGSAVISFWNRSPINDETRECSWCHLHPSSIPLLRNFYVPNFYGLYSLVRKISSAEVVFVHSLFAFHTLVALVWSLALGKSLFIVPHGCLDNYVFCKKRIIKSLWLLFVGRPLLVRAKYVLFASASELDSAKSICNFPFTSRVIGLPAPADLFRCYSSAHRTARRPFFDLPSGSRILVSHGRLHNVKRFQSIVYSFSRLGLKNAFLVILGPDGDITFEQLRQLCNELNLSNVAIRGPLYGQQLFELLSLCDGYISWSERENFNYSLVECMSLGLPVVVSLGNALASDVRDSACGWSPLGDSDDQLLILMHEFFSCSESSLIDRGNRARQLALSRYSFRKFSSSLLSLMA